MKRIKKMKDTKLILKTDAVLRRYTSMTRVIYDTTHPWVRGGRAKDIAESSDSNSEILYHTSGRLLIHLKTIDLVLEEPLWGDQYSSFMDQKSHEKDADIRELAIKSLSLLCDYAMEKAEKFRQVRSDVQGWVTGMLNESDEEALDYRLNVVDYHRWQILKEFSKLVALFNDHDDLDSKYVTPEWRQDQSALDEA
jgi:hypothetical protein